MQINDIVLGLAAGVGVRLSPDGKTAYYVEWSIGRLCKVEVQTGMVTTVITGLESPEDVLVDWDTNEIFVSERTGSIVQVFDKEGKRNIAEPGHAPHQLALVKQGGNRYLYTVCYDSGRLIRIDLDSGGTINPIGGGLGHPGRLGDRCAQQVRLRHRTGHGRANADRALQRGRSQTSYWNDQRRFISHGIKSPPASSASSAIRPIASCGSNSALRSW